MNTPVNPSFTIYKWSVRGYTLHGNVSMMEFRIYEEEGLCYLCSDSKALISCAATVQLICAFVFACNNRFSMTWLIIIIYIVLPYQLLFNSQIDGSVSQ